MTEPAILAEIPAPYRPIPAFELPGWREEFGVVAGVTGRGSEAVPFDLGLASDQPTSIVLDHWRQFALAFPDFSAIVVGRQIHGVGIRWHDRAAGWSVFPDVDGHATATSGILLAVTLADCVPIYVIDPVTRAVALLHAGWRGTAQGILAIGIDLLKRRIGSDLANLVVHCGVGICGRCYQVGADVAQACGRPPTVPGPTNLDLRAVIAEQAARQGIARVSVSSHCSAHIRDYFFSHRGSGGMDGRMLAFLGLLPSRSGSGWGAICED